MRDKADYQIFPRKLPSGKTVYYYWLYDSTGKRRSISTVRLFGIVLSTGRISYTLPPGKYRTSVPINTFRLWHLEQLGGLFTQIVLLCKKLGMIGFEHMAIDGQKIHADANFRKSKNLKGLKNEYEKVKTGIEKLLSKEVDEYFTKETKEKRLNMTDTDAAVMNHKDGTSKQS